MTLDVGDRLLGDTQHLSLLVLGQPGALVRLKGHGELAALFHPAQELAKHVGQAAPRTHVEVATVRGEA